jgi:hypothetical protein
MKTQANFGKKGASWLQPKGWQAAIAELAQSTLQHAEDPSRQNDVILQRA